MSETTSRNHPLFTIGYADLNPDRFVILLKKHMIEAVADVRSSPYSKFYTDFNQDNLKQMLNRQGIKYVFLGKELGAQRTESECYENGKVSYDLVFDTEAFQEGVKRLLKGISQMRIALLCAEKDPLNCHRAILVCRYLRDLVSPIKHIRNNGQLENHSDLERRLLRLFNLNNIELFRSEQDILQHAYRKQAEKIAFEKEGLFGQGKEIRQ